jgi:SAM-dependent methyltransferase
VKNIYVCPNCKAPLDKLSCRPCGQQYAESNGFPVLLPGGEEFSAAPEIVEAYDSIYTHHSNVWENQGRSPEFIGYFSALLRKYPARRLLEVGCGEGLLLAALTAEEKYGTELSVQALVKTRARTQAQLCLALGEKLPYEDGAFDTVTSVGVMEHFIDDRAATREMRRVLRDEGRYVVLIHVRLSSWQSLQQKISEYVFPSPHPLRLARWLVGKFYRPIHQPVQNNYTVASARACLEDCGFVVEQVINKQTLPSVPLIGPHVVIFVCRKPGRLG